MPVINLVLLCSKCTLPCPALILSACATVRPCRGRYENTKGASLPGSRAFLLAPAAQLPVGSFPVRSGHDQNTDSSSLTPARSTSVNVSAILRSISMWTNTVPSQASRLESRPFPWVFCVIPGSCGCCLYVLFLYPLEFYVPP